MPKNGKPKGKDSKEKKEGNMLSWREQQRLNTAREKRLRKRCRRGQHEAPLAANG